jgi:hypothetical protein
MLHAQIFFLVSELASSLVAVRFLDANVPIVPAWLWFCIGITLVHLYLSGLNQMVWNLLMDPKNAPTERVARDTGLVVGDLGVLVCCVWEVGSKLRLAHHYDHCPNESFVSDSNSKRNGNAIAYSRLSASFPPQNLRNTQMGKRTSSDSPDGRSWVEDSEETETQTVNQTETQTARVTQTARDAEAGAGPDAGPDAEPDGANGTNGTSSGVSSGSTSKPLGSGPVGSGPAGSGPVGRLHGRNSADYALLDESVPYSTNLCLIHARWMMVGVLVTLVGTRFIPGIGV